MSRVASDDLGRLQGVPRELSRWQKAQQLLLGGDNALALSLYRDLLSRFPNVPQLWFERGMAAVGDLEFEEAHSSFEQMAKLAPKDVALLVLAGQQYHRLRQLDRANACYEKAVAADTNSVHAWLSLAASFERQRQLSKAWDCVQSALSKRPKDAHALYYQAFLMHRHGENAEARNVLEDMLKRAVSPEPAVRCSAHHLLGVILGELGDYPRAMRLLLEAKTQLRQLVGAPDLEKQYDAAALGRRSLLAAITSENIRHWRDETRNSFKGERIVFLGGHPRSGTTLIEQVLGAHPGVLAFDEPDGFSQEIERGLSPRGRPLTLADIDAIPPERHVQLRRRYFRSLLREHTGGTNGSVLLDKNPSPTASLPLWLKIFPELKVVIPLRDPRDVVISCYFQNLPATTVSVNFLSLERTVQHYCDLMDVWLHMRDLGGFDWLETRYEDVVHDLEAEGRRLTRFMELEWDSAQAKFHENARKKFVFAPTYHEVTKPVYTSAIGRWQNYAEFLEPFQAKLAPYCSAFGYS